PAAGAFSDRFSSRWGRRLPFMFVATLTDLVFLAAIAFAPNYWMLLVSYCLLQFSSNVAHGPYQGLLPDLVPEQQRGTASSIKQFIDTFGLVVAAVVTPLILANPDMKLDDNIRVMIAAIAFLLVGTMLLNVFLVREPPSPPITSPRRRDWFSIAALERLVSATVKFTRQFPDFSWLIASRLAILGALAFLSNYAQFYFQKVLFGNITNLEQAIKAAVSLQGNLLETVVVFMLVIALFSGPLSDRFGRRPINGLGGLFAAAGAAVLLFVRNVPVITLPFGAISDLLIAGGLIGIGMGLYTSANWAWAVDLTPPSEAARFLGLTNLATAGATVVTSVLGPVIGLLNAQEAGRGFTFMFVVGIVGFLLGVGMLGKVRETRGSHAAAEAAVD
ncbi:MAG: MFS transporter, partial [Chloroflexota bacterium]|nr:MFS transporter [Chloroflexota bacterium]